MAMVHKMVGRPTQLGEVRSRGVPTQATVASVRTSLPTIKQATDPSAGRVVSSVCPIPAMVPQPRVQTGPSTKKKETEPTMLASVDALAQQLQLFMQQQQQIAGKDRDRQGTMLQWWLGPRHLLRLETVGTAQSNNRPFRGISKEDDSRTQDGVPLCGRCGYKGYGRATRGRARMRCMQCEQMGHIRYECESDAGSGYGGDRFGGRGPRGPSKCFFCEDTGHVVAECPAIRSLRSLTVGSVGDHAVGTDKEEKVIAEVNEVEEVGAKEVEVEDVCSLSVVQESVPEEKTDVMVIDAAEEKVGKEVFEVDKEAPVSTTFCEMAENTVDAKVVADPKVVETSKTVVVRSKVPVPKVKVLKSILKKSGGKSARVAVSISYRTNKIEIGVESVSTVAEEVVTVPVKKAAQESDCKTVDDPEGSKYAPLFTDKKLAAMEACEPGQESTVLAGVKDTVEKDEYDKELEDRLYPLYEVELKRRMKNIAEAKKEPSIEDMSEYLGIPVNVLELTRKTEGFSLTLEKASEAKKANRDFHQAAADSAGSLDEVDCADSADSDKESNSEEALITVDEAAVEQRVCQYRGAS
ncbi:Zinc finger, CCHC-type [Phytophthora cactorum]|nr:Zinc finger, CCHC-type [Phytophthora cactorum]